MMSGFATARLNITFNETVTNFNQLGNLIIDLVDVGLDVMIHVLQRFPEIAVLLFVVGVILAILAMIKGVFGTIGGFFRMFADLSGKKHR